MNTDKELHKIGTKIHQQISDRWGDATVEQRERMINDFAKTTMTALSQEYKLGRMHGMMTIAFVWLSVEVLGMFLFG